MEIGACGRAPAAILRVDLVNATTFGSISVEVVTPGQAHFTDRGKEVPVHPVNLVGHILDMDRSLALLHTLAGHPGFKALVSCLYIRPAPTCRAGGLPVFEISRQTSAIDHGVDRAGATQQSTAGPVDTAPAEAFVWFGHEAPRAFWVGIQLAIAEWQRHPG